MREVKIYSVLCFIIAGLLIALMITLNIIPDKEFEIKMLKHDIRMLNIEMRQHLEMDTIRANYQY